MEEGRKVGKKQRKKERRKKKDNMFDEEKIKMRFINGTSD